MKKPLLFAVGIMTYFLIGCSESPVSVSISDLETIRTFIDAYSYLDCDAVGNELCEDIGVCECYERTEYVLKLSNDVKCIEECTYNMSNFDIRITERWYKNERPIEKYKEHVGSWTRKDEELYRCCGLPTVVIYDTDIPRSFIDTIKAYSP